MRAGLLTPSTAGRLGILLAAIGILSGCGSGGSAAEASYGDPFAVVTLDPGAGAGEPVALAGARILKDGEAQVLVEGGACLVPTKLSVVEGADSVKVQAFAHDTSGSGGCTMQIVPWFIRMSLENGLGGRTMIDSGTGEPVRVVDCAAKPTDAWCEHPAA